MEIELKRIAYNPRLGIDAFAANLFVNGQKAAMVSSTGSGTQYYPVDGKGAKLVAEAEEYAKKIPIDRKIVDGREQDVMANLGTYIEKLFAIHLAEIELKKFDKKVDQVSKRNIVIGERGKYMRTVPTGTPIEMLQTGAGRQLLVKTISERALPTLSENERILNTNIPADILKDAGITDKHLPKQEQKNEVKTEQENTKKTKRQGTKV